MSKTLGSLSWLPTVSRSNGVKSTLTMTELNLHRNWKWVGRFLWLTIAFDHRFEKLSPTQTSLTWIIEAKGLGVSLFRRLLATFYGKNLDRAIPLLVEEMQARFRGDIRQEPERHESCPNQQTGR